MSRHISFDKIRKASRLLLYRSHGKPGIRGWELRSQLGEKYVDIILATDRFFRENLGLKIIAVDKEGREIPIIQKNEQVLRRSIFLVLINEPLSIKDLKTSGWRIDEIASLAISLLYLLSHNGMANLNDIKNILITKISRRRVPYILSKLIRLGYLEEKDDKIVIGWRSKIEVNLEKLIGVV